MNRIQLTVALVVMLCAARAGTEIISTTPYTLSISESQQVLAHPGNEFVAEIASSTTGHELAVERSEPYLLLTNTSSTAMTEFTMTIGDNDDHFRFVGGPSPMLTSSGVTMTSSISSQTTSQDLISINFATNGSAGLAPGASVEFRVGIAPDAADANPLVSYGHVFFNNGSDPTLNSVITTYFAPNTSTSTMIPNQSATDAASPLTTSANCNCGTLGVGVSSFNLDPPPDITVVTTPEPSTLVLFALGMTGLAGWARRRRRRLPPPRDAGRSMIGSPAFRRELVDTSG